MCVWIFCTTFVWNISHSNTNSARYCHNAHRSSCKVPVILVIFYWNWNFPRQSFKQSSNISFHETPSSDSRGVPFGRTDTTKLIDACRIVANEPKNASPVSAWCCTPRDFGLQSTFSACSSLNVTHHVSRPCKTTRNYTADTEHQIWQLEILDRPTSVNPRIGEGLPLSVACIERQRAASNKEVSLWNLDVCPWHSSRCHTVFVPVQPRCFYGLALRLFRSHKLPLFVACSG